MIRVLFVCEHNSARSQIAEAYLKKYGGDKFHAESAGIEPGNLNPYVVESMLEDGIDISGATTDSVIKYFQEERQYEVVITVCSPEVDKRCPIFPGKALRMNRPFPDPSQLEGDKGEIISQIRPIREAIKTEIKNFIEAYQTKGLKIFVEQDSS